MIVDALDNKTELAFTNMKLNVDVNRVLQLPEVKDKFAGLGAESMPMGTDQFALHLRAEIAKFAKAIKDSGATAE